MKKIVLQTLLAMFSSNAQIVGIIKKGKDKMDKLKVSSLKLTGVIILLFLLLPELSTAQAGAIDPTFNPTDMGFGTGDGADGIIYTTALQSDGKILIGGNFIMYNGTTRNRIARVNVDGTLDATFNPSLGANGNIFISAIQSDGKILIGGNFTTYDGTTRNRIARLNSDGSLDATFNPGTGTDNVISEMEIQTDGKIIIGGSFTIYNGTTRNRIARLNTDGSLDTTFNPTTGADNSVAAIALQNDGKILIGGNFTTYNGTTRIRIARVNSDGSLDPTFNPSTGADNTIATIAIQSNGKILIGGNFTMYNGTTRNRIARINEDGTLDATFNPNSGAENTIIALALQSNGKILIGGSFSSYNGTTRNRIASVNTDGSLDTLFNPGTGAENPINSFSLQSDGKIICGGFFSLYNGAFKNRLARINTDGSLDGTFNSFFGINGIYGFGVSVLASALQADGKILIAGNFSSYNGTVRKNIARLNADGSIDASFNTGEGPNDSVVEITTQSDGKILIGGQFTSFNGISRNRIVRLNTDGSVDLTFNPGTGANGEVSAMSIQTDGKIVIGGAFTTFNGNNRNRIARLNNDGSIDSTFTNVIGANNNISNIKLLSDGKIIIAGDFTTYGGVSRIRIARTNSNGSLDTTFNPGSGADGSILSVAIQPDEKILIGGFFTTYGGVLINRIARLNPNGTLDTTFNPGEGANNGVFEMEIQNDGKIIIVGGFVSYDVVSRNRIARINANGSLDGTFNPSLGANNTIWTLVLQPDNKIVIGGQFTSYNGIGRNRVTRINGTNHSITASPFGPTSYCQGATIPVPYSVTDIFNSGNVFTVQLSDATGSFATPISIGTLSSITNGTITAVVPTTTLPGSGYRVRVVSSNPVVIGSDNGSNLVVNSVSSATVNETACDSYTWALNGTTYTSSGTYTHVGTNAAGCDLTTTLILTIQDVTAPVANVATLSNISSECAVTSITVPTATDNCAGTITGILNVSLPITEIGTTTITWTYNDGNGNISTQTQDIVITPIDNGITQVNPITLSANASGYNYQWVDCNNSNALVSGATSQTFTPNVAGSYACIIDNGACSVTTACLSTTLSNADNYFDNTISVFPNPFSDVITFDFNGFVNGKIEMYSLDGKLVFTKDGKEINQLETDLSELKNGVYMVRVTTNNTTIIKKIIKE